MSYEDNPYKKVVDNIVGLPTLPSLVNRIIDIMASPNCSSREISIEIEKNPVFAARILKMANSAFYGSPRQISSINQAVVLLGFSTLRDAVFAASVVKMFPEDKSRSVSFARDDFWIHAFACGIATRVLAKYLNFPRPAQFFMAGLLHDIGKLILDQFIHQDFLKIVNYVEEKDCLFLTAEQELLAANHALLGGWLAEKWNLPVELTETIFFHHNPQEAPTHKQVCALVALADVLVRALDIGAGGDKRIPHLTESNFELTGLSQNSLAEIIPLVFSEAKESENLLESFK